ncbi:MAG: DUF4857 domain-containing protein [Bacteroidales bacterium]|jgi:hypothetical protein|nr:DUF4857 domain-containing protein [Bacteroidales bacterium]
MIKLLRIILVVVTTIVASIILPAMLKHATDKPITYKFGVYSELAQKLFYYEYQKNNVDITDKDGNKYSTAGADSLMPIYNSRQLTQMNKMPDSIMGIPVTQRDILSSTHRINIENDYADKPDDCVGMLYESMPKRVGLVMPQDIFRFTSDGIEFENDETHEIDIAKSRTFTNALLKSGVTFPIKSMSGEINARKRYDEGYFLIDAKGELFHMKMVNGKPFIRNTNVTDTLQMARFSMSLPNNRSYYGIIISADSSLWILETGDNSYSVKRLDIPPISLGQDNVRVLGSLFYWTIFVTNDTGRYTYILDSKTLKRVDEGFLPCPEITSNKWLSRCFFVYTELHHVDSYFDYPRPKFGGWIALILNAIIASIYLTIRHKRLSKRDCIASALYLVITGVSGLAGLLLVPYERHKQTIKR